MIESLSILYFMVCMTDGSLQLLNQLDYICAALRANKSASYELKKLQFWIFELQTESSEISDKLEKTKFLLDSFFSKKKFSTTNDNGLGDLCLVQAMCKRQAHKFIIGLLLRALGESIGINANFINLKKYEVLDFNIDGKHHLVDLSSGKLISEDEIIKHINTPTPLFEGQYQSKIDEDLFCPVSEYSILNHYYFLLEDNIKLGIDFDIALEFQTRALEVIPDLTSALMNRALLFLKKGNKEDAYHDLKRYLLLTDPRKQSPSVKELFKSLSQELHCEQDFVTEI